MYSSLDTYIEIYEDNKELFNFEFKKVEKKDSFDLKNTMELISNNLTFTSRLFNYKFYLLSKSITQFKVDNNPLSLVNNSRSLIEHCCLFFYLVSNLEKILKKLENQSSDIKIKEIIDECNTLINRVYYGRDGGAGNEKKIHINDSIRELKSEIPHIEEIYAYLCEHVHPNFNSNLLISDGKIGSGYIEYKESEHINGIINISNESIKFYISIQLDINKSNLVIKKYLEILKENTSVGKTFSKKDSKPKGDGKTKDNAFFFNKSRNSIEDIQLTYEHLKNIGFIGEKVNSDYNFKDNYVINTFKNKKDEIIYFKNKL